MTSPRQFANPSRFSKRVPLAVLALVGCVLSARLGMYQLGLAAVPPDPFFTGTATVLGSAFSHALPIPDAALGSAAYAFEALLALAGGSMRWRCRPWLAIGYGAVALAMAMVGAGLVVTQATVEHAWCSLCLLSAAISFVIVGPAMAEGFASLRHRRVEAKV